MAFLSDLFIAWLGADTDLGVKLKFCIPDQRFKDKAEIPSRHSGTICTGLC